MKESKNANHIIFLDFLTGMKTVVPENFDFNNQKISYTLDFLRLG